MPQITIYLHQDLADRILAAGPEGALSLSALLRQASRAVRSHGSRSAYAPAVLPNGVYCAMSVHVGHRGMVVEVDRPGTLIPGRDVVAEQPAARLRSTRR